MTDPEWQSPSVSSSARLDDIVDRTAEGTEKILDDSDPLKPGAGDAPIFVPSVSVPAAPGAFEPAEGTTVGHEDPQHPAPLPARSRPEPDSTSESAPATSTVSAKTRPESVGYTFLEQKLDPKDESFLSPSVAPECVMQSSAEALVPELLPVAESTKTSKDAAAGVEDFSVKPDKKSVVDLIYWRDIKKTGLVFGASLFLLLSMTIFSIVSVIAYLALALLSVTISFRIYRGILQAVQKSDEGHPFKACLETDIAVSDELVRKYSDVGLSHINHVITELRRLFLVEDLVDSLKFSVLMWLLTYVGALFNGLSLLIIALVAVFSIPVVYERHQAQIDHYIGIASKQIRDITAKIQTKIPGLKKKTE
ncbi:reticulon-4-like isoform X3 [Stegostoma tigrinum]|uniref:reticulon-4-like isoform X3 n=1 Tax=Stegostoma tigrinum TaxID=3053191 RepID=UPI00202B0BB5|nr:reticulon-4-like isoform X3 [Stegostoma tigrinum]